MKPTPDQESEISALLDRLGQLPDAGHKMLELATALSNQGRHRTAAHVELAALNLSDPEVTHHWRLLQAGRAPANQFLLLSNNLRTSAFQKALSEQVRSTDLILEIGTGSGILAMLAAKAGAAHVVTCERQPLMASVAQGIIRDNQLQEKITVLPKAIRELEIGADLPRRANILLADLFTGDLLEAGGLRLIQEARTKLACNDSHVIPSSATLRGRLVGGPDLERLCRSGNTSNLNLSRFNLFSPPVVQILPERFSTLHYQAFSDAIDCFQFDFSTLEGCQPRRRTTTLKSSSGGKLLGFLQWLSLELSPGNVLESDETSPIAWSRYLHVFPQPIEMTAGQTVQLHIEHNWTRFSVWPLS